MDFKIKQLHSPDIEQFKELVEIFVDVFEMDNFILPDTNYLQEILNRQNFISLVAIFDNKIIGGLTSYVLPSYYCESSQVYIYDLAVNKIFQRKGIGRKLLEGLAECCKKYGYQEFFVQADIEYKHALDFYHSTGGIAQSVVHYSYTIRQEEAKTKSH